MHEAVAERIQEAQVFHDRHYEVHLSGKERNATLRSALDSLDFPAEGLPPIEQMRSVWLGNWFLFQTFEELDSIKDKGAEVEEVRPSIKKKI